MSSSWRSLTPTQSIFQREVPSSQLELFRFNVMIFNREPFNSHAQFFHGLSSPSAPFFLGWSDPIVSLELSDSKQHMPTCQVQKNMISLSSLHNTNDSLKKIKVYYKSPKQLCEYVFAYVLSVKVIEYHTKHGSKYPPFKEKYSPKSILYRIMSIL